jgi:ABC-type glycerol-3-phosphate transport system substrate-binding protein
VAAYPHQINGWRAFGDLWVDIHIYSDDPNWGLTESTMDDMVVPPGPGLPISGSAYYIFYNQTWAQELGFDSPPTTPDEFEDQACAASAQRNDGLGGWVINTHPSGLLSWVHAFGGEVSNAQGEYRFESTQIESAFTFLRGLMDKGCAWISPETYPNQAFAERQALFYESSLTGIPFQLDAFDDADNQDEWIPIPYPAEAGDPVIVMYTYQLAVMRTAPEKQLAAWIFAEWLSEPEQQAAFARTVERLPIRLDAVALLDEGSSSSGWIDALNWLGNSQSEPTTASWDDVRWALSDAGVQMFAPGTVPLDIPAILAELQLVAEEIQALTP